ncbi:MAG: signal peptide peptidase SppA, partial [Coriobacteriia bacterium]
AAVPSTPTSPAFVPSPASLPADRPRTHRGWIWVLVIALSLSAVIGSCGWAVSLIGGGKSDGIVTGNGIAVIPMDGAIAGTGSMAGGIITPEGFLDKLNQAQDDSNIKAIVLRVNSPGGTVAASEEISAYVKAAKKPVVVSVGDVDASGAYMVSSQADKIIALPGSAVGSIGVITEIPNVNGLLDKLGIQFVTITAGKYKGAGSPYRALTATETALIQGSVDEVYTQFVDIVAEGRKMDRSKVESLATGWAWNGAQAKKLGLIDELGTYEDALKAAAKLGGITGEYKVVRYDDSSINTLLTTLLGISNQLGNLNAAGQLSGQGGGVAVPK